MQLLSTLTPLALLVTVASATGKAVNNAVGNAVVTNHCKDPIYLWSVGSSVSPKHTIPSGSNYTEPFRHDDASGGIALKITRTDNGLYDGSAQLIYSYALDGEQVWYDLSSVFGDAFAGEAVAVKPENEGCGSICWPKGTTPGGSQVKVCDAEGDVGLVVCAKGC